MLGRNNPQAVSSEGWRGRSAGQGGEAAQTFCKERSSRLHQGFHRDQVLKGLRWNDYVCSEGLEIKITLLSVARANWMLILGLELSWWHSHGPWACPRSLCVQWRIQPLSHSSDPCCPARLFCFSKPPLFHPSASSGRNNCSSPVPSPALLSPAPA